MPVYLIIEARVKDQEKFEKYTSELSSIVPAFGGSYLVHGGRARSLNEGLKPDRRQPGRFLVLEFPSEVDLRRCWSSPEYKSIMSYSHDGAETRAVMLEGKVVE